MHPQHDLLVPSPPGSRGAGWTLPEIEAAAFCSEADSPVESEESGWEDGYLEFLDVTMIAVAAEKVAMEAMETMREAAALPALALYSLDVWENAVSQYAMEIQ